VGGVSTGVMAGLNIAIKLDEKKENVAKNFEILGDALGFGLSDLVLTRQIHSCIVRTVTRADCNGCFHRDYPECDALVTCDPGTALMVFTADCTPVLLHDPVTGAVGAAHAGWRGTAQQIAVKTAEAMAAHFGCKPENIRAAIGPNIGQCHFETDADVPEAILAAYGEDARQWIEVRGEKFHLDLKQINALGLRQLGITQIDISESCTACQPHRFWSHRVTLGQRGAQGGIIVCKEVQP
jgi:YfiH family protein